jgi:hypothetical protein
VNFQKNGYFGTESSQAAAYCGPKQSTYSRTRSNGNSSRYNIFPEGIYFLILLIRNRV